MTDSTRLGVGVIGAGHVGPVLARALAGAGHAIVGISAVSVGSIERAQGMLPGVPILEPQEVVRRAELVVLAVPAAEIPELVSGLTKLEAWQPGQLVMHTAARFGTEVFDVARSAAIIPLAIHPAIRFSGTSLDLARLAGAACAVTAPAPVLPIAQALVVEMGGEPVVVAESDRAVYAEAVEAAGDFSAALVRQGISTLRERNIDRAEQLIAGVVRASIEEALRAEAGVDPTLGA